MKICLCGSTRFMDQYQIANRLLTLAGHVVYTVAAVSTGDHPDLTPDEKVVLDAVHLSKIEESDAIMVVGFQEDGSMYIGESTKREIAFARIRDKQVYYYAPEQEVGGPNSDFIKDLKAAATTTAEREEQRRRAEERQREFSAIFGSSGNGPDDEVDHSDDPEKPVEETTN